MQTKYTRVRTLMLTQYHSIIAAYRSKTNSHLPAVIYHIPQVILGRWPWLFIIRGLIWVSQSQKITFFYRQTIFDFSLWKIGLKEVGILSNSKFEFCRFVGVDFGNIIENGNETNFDHSVTRSKNQKNIKKSKFKISSIDRSNSNTNCNTLSINAHELYFSMTDHKYDHVNFKSIMSIFIQLYAWYCGLWRHS